MSRPAVEAIRPEDAACSPAGRDIRPVGSMSRLHVEAIRPDDAVCGPAVRDIPPAVRMSRSAGSMSRLKVEAMRPEDVVCSPEGRAIRSAVRMSHPAGSMSHPTHRMSRAAGSSSLYDRAPGRPPVNRGYSAHGVNDPQKTRDFDRRGRGGARDSTTDLLTPQELGAIVGRGQPERLFRVM
jgi:hypothetical protein